MEKIDILLVDDEQYVIDGLVKNIDWQAYGAEHVYTANSVWMAKKILEDNVVHILVCDIVMPQGTGIDLLSWIRQKGDQIDVIFLTSYAEFDYAKKAIELECVDYLLKPIDYARLEEVIVRTIGKINERQEIAEQKKEEERRKSRDFLIQLINEPEHVTLTIIERQNKHSSYYLPCLIHLYYDQDDEGIEEQECLQVMNELFCQVLENSQLNLELIYMKEYMKFIVILSSFQQEIHQKAEIVFRTLLENLADRMNVDYWCGEGMVCRMEDIGANIRDIVTMRQSDYSIWNVIEKIENRKNIIKKDAKPNIEMWNTLLHQKQEEALIEKISDYIDWVGKSRQVNMVLLSSFRADLIQLLYTFLAENEIKAHLLFCDDTSHYMYRICTESLKGCKKFINHYVRTTFEYMRFANQTQTVAETICSYIDAHYEEDISREELAKVVYLNPDYISRVFKRETGLSIKKYLNNKRLGIAKELLEVTMMPIQAVAMNTGYSNFAYFTKLFRETYGESPIEYRKTHNKESL